MLRFLITDILFTLVFMVTTAIYVVHLEDRKGISRETSRQMADEVKAKLYNALPNCMKVEVPLWIAVPITAFLCLFAPIWLGWYIFETIRMIDKYDPKEEKETA